MARAQGFRDTFVVDLTDVSVKLASRLFGNAVPVLLAEALGKELVEVRFQQYCKNEMESRNMRTSGRSSTMCVMTMTIARLVQHIYGGCISLRGVFSHGDILRIGSRT